MSAWHRIFRLFTLVALAFAGLVLVQVAMSEGHWQAFLTQARTERLVSLGAGWSMLLLALLFLVTGLKRKRKGRFLSFENEGGRVNISTDAIADYLSKLANEFPSVIKMNIRVVPLKGALDIVLAIRVKADPQIHEICETLQSRVRESLSSGLGIRDVRRVEVSVNEINSERRGARNEMNDEQ